MILRKIGAVAAGICLGAMVLPPVTQAAEAQVDAARMKVAAEAEVKAASEKTAAEAEAGAARIKSEAEAQAKATQAKAAAERQAEDARIWAAAKAEAKAAQDKATAEAEADARRAKMAAEADAKAARKKALGTVNWMPFFGLPYPNGYVHHPPRECYSFEQVFDPVEGFKIVPIWICGASVRATY
jgi:hypothetical protein